mgnify:CR=1 FL=1
MRVRKRDNSIQEFSKEKIIIAVGKAMKAGGHYSEKLAQKIADDIVEKFKDIDIIPICDIEIAVFDALVRHGKKHIARLYEGYRAIREFQRKASNDIETQVSELVEGISDYWNNENSNKNEKLVTTQRDYMAGIVSTNIARKYLLTPDIVQAHDNGIIHIHDMDYIAENARNNCSLINLEDMLQNGTVLNGVTIDKPHRLITATTIATQVILGVSSAQYGGCTITLSHLAPFVRSSYESYLSKYKSWGISDKKAEEFAKIDLNKEISDSVQTFNYQVNSMSSSNGQAPFITVFMYIDEDEEYKEETALLIAEFLRQRIIGLKNRTGHYVTQAFPKLIYVLDEDNIHEDSEYFWVTKLAIKSTAKRMNPDYVSAKIMKQYKGAVISSMGCRSWLTTDRVKTNVANANNWVEGKKYYGRFNQGVVTINLPDIALSSHGDMNLFWKLFEERTELCHKALRIRHERLLGTLSDVAPILWQDGALARLKVHEPIDKLLYGGYSTISLGYAGLYECVKYMTGKSHTDHADGETFAIKVMQGLNDKCAEWKLAEDIDYSVYGSPIESTTYKFAKCLKDRFGVIKDITDHNYITNSYHVNVREEIDPFEKLNVESKFQKLSPGGAISYVESCDMNKNLEALLSIVRHIYDTMVYAEINTKSDYCQKCDYTGEISILDNDGELYWECPNCGNTDKSTMNVARRTCGYIGTNFWNQGRTQEIKERYVHLDNHEIC